MKKTILSVQGHCYASLVNEEDILAHRQELKQATWIPQRIRWLEALKDPTRFKLTYLLYNHEMLCVCDFANILEVSPSAISQHMRKLKDLDLVSVHRSKQTLFYTLLDSPFRAFFERLICQEGANETIPVRI